MRGCSRYFSWGEFRSFPHSGGIYLGKEVLHLKSCSRIPAVFLAVLLVLFLFRPPAEDVSAADFDPMPPPAGSDFSPYRVTAALCPPLEAGDVTSPFGWRFHPMSGALDFHTGADLSCPEGTRISALLGGTVLVSEYHESYGNYLLLDHGYGFETLYAHCSALLAGEGETVRPGEPIALSGQTGDATGPHLHLEIRMNGVRLNPAWLPFWEDYGKETP